MSGDSAGDLRCDVLVVGGGPAGSTLARSLSRRGFDVVVADRSTFPRDKVCAGWITPRVVDLAEIDLADYGRTRILQPIHGFRVGLAGRERPTPVERDPISYGIRRCEFDRYLLEASGARTRLGFAVRSIERRSGEWIVNDRLRARVLVGAGGHACPVARHLNPGLRSGGLVIAAQEIEPQLTEVQLAATHVDPRVPLISFCADLAGYGWAFRKGRFLNVGLGRESGHALRAWVAAYAADLGARGEIPEDLPDTFHGHAYLLYSHPARRVVAEGALLIGDAAGLAHAQSGEGILPAVLSGLIAAEVIATASEHATADGFAGYAERLAERFGPRRTSDGSAWLPQPAREFLARMLLRNRWFNHHVVIDRWFLDRHRSRGRPRRPSDAWRDACSS